MLEQHIELSDSASVQMKEERELRFRPLQCRFQVLLLFVVESIVKSQHVLELINWLLLELLRLTITRFGYSVFLFSSEEHSL
jgi:hypothetical protein